MPRFTALIFDVTPGARREEARSIPEPLKDFDQTGVLTMYRRWLLKTPRDFSARLRLPTTLKGQRGEIQIELRWLAAGDTVGVALWSNRDHTVAASILLNGLESAQDLVRVDQVLAHRGYAIPPPLRPYIDNEQDRPLMVSMFYSRGAMQFRELLTAMPLFARAFFDLFGTTQP